MNELFKTLRLAAYVLALPLAITAVVSAKNFVSNDSPVVQDEVVSVETLPAAPTVAVEVGDAFPFVMHMDGGDGVSGRIAIVGDDGNRYGAQDLDVTLNRRGTVVGSTRTDNTGEFRFEGIMPGSYTFIASNDDAVSAFGVYVVNSDATPANGEIQSEFLAVGGGNIGSVREVLNKEYESTGGYEYLVDPLRDNLPVQNGSNRVALDADGNLVGQVAPLDWQNESGSIDLTGNSVKLYADGVLVADVSLGPGGRYSISGVEPGYYDLISAGPHGNAAIGIDVVPHHAIAHNGDDVVVTAGFNPELQDQDPPYQAPGGGPGGADLVLCEPALGGPSVQVDVLVGGCPSDCGGCNSCGYGGGFGGGGFGGGGGGGFGGLGNIGDWIGLAVGGYVLTEIIDRLDDDDNVIQQPVVVPPVVIPPASPSN